jgi:hypothetical protein
MCQDSRILRGDHGRPRYSIGPACGWLPKDGRFQCPKHESRYQPTGIFTSGRATRNMDRLGVRLEGNMLVVDVSKFVQSDKDQAGWAVATVSL